jgi:hypothetical protein
VYTLVSNNNQGVVVSCERYSSCGHLLENGPCAYCACIIIQSDVITEGGGESSQTQQGTTSFMDESVGLKVGLDEGYDGISALDQTEEADLSRFLSRPVRIGVFTWNETDAVGTTHNYNPWSLFFSDTRVKYKCNNFAFIQCKLKVKVLINASPFYYGAMIGAYQPNPGLTPSTIVNDSGSRWLIPTSQRPHMWILPQGSKADEMTLPFFWHKNFLNMQDNQNMIDMGKLQFINYTSLASANGATGVGVTVQIYAWAEDVKLSGPSVGLSVQGDEYGNGVVSAPASAIASAASWFEDIPIIGRFATATRIGASAVSTIASLFGFTNVPNIKDTDSFRPTAFPQLATTTISYPTEKLTLDPKNELTVDPSVLGLPPIDEMVIANLVQKESYLTTATWANTNSVDDLLFTSIVNPTLHDNDNGSSPKVYLTPMAWMSLLFKEWRGDIIFRFKFIATPYHKGRVRISYDPSGYSGENIISDSVSQNVVQTQIIDLGEESDIEIRIPYQQATAFMQTRQDYSAAKIGWSTSLSPTFLYSNVFDNGTITMRVQTLLTAPVAVTSIPIMVFVRAAENMEFANPSANLSQFAPGAFTVQSEVYGDPLTLVSGAPARTHPERYLVNFGESVKSLRQLLRRQTLSYNVPNTTDNTDVRLIQKYRFGRWPLYFGYDPNGINSAKGVVATTTNFPFNFAQSTPYCWVAPAFIGQRGSMQWTFNVDTNLPLRHVRVYRDNGNSGKAGFSTATAASKGTQSAQASFYCLNVDDGSAGQALTNQFTNSGLTVQLPNYTRFRFQSTSPANSTALSSSDGSDIDAYVLEVSSSPVVETNSSTTQTIWAYSGIGTDFGLYFFLNCPVVWQYATYPVAN